MMAALWKHTARTAGDTDEIGRAGRSADPPSAAPVGACGALGRRARFMIAAVPHCKLEPGPLRLGTDSRRDGRAGAALQLESPNRRPAICQAELPPVTESLP